MNSDKLNELSKNIHSPVPFWFLNGQVDEWHIVREFEMMREKGIGDVIVHPRYGLQVEYLSEEWFTIFGWCVREAKKQGMHVWIYDEFNWPSGTAGMTVMQNDPGYQGKYLAVETRPLSEIDLTAFQPGLHIIAANIEGDYVSKTRLLDGIESLKALTGEWRIFNCTLKHDRFYIDTLSKNAVDCFKRVTYDEYYKRFGDEFGATIHAIFTDEPSIYWVSVGYDDRNLPYTEDYFSTFESKYGYDPAPMLPYLFYPGRESTRFRADYWEHAGALFNERYHGNLGAWCREHGVIYTGHNNHEEPLRYQIRFQGNMFDTMRAMDIPGVDHLAKQTLGNSFISIIGHKICSSEAHISGKARCMSESFGCMGWDASFVDMKRVTDWQFAQGINLLIPHAIYHTISGMTKRECPPSFFYQSPHWDDFGDFAAYVKRMEDMLCGGRHLCKVAVMYPISGLWASYQTDRKTTEFEHTDNFLDSLCQELLKRQVDFDLLDFRALKDAKLEDGRIKLADEEYEVFIVPAAPYLRPAEISRLNEIVAAGINTTFFHKAMEPLQHNLPEGLRGATFVRSEELVVFVDIVRKQLDDDIQLTGGGSDDIMAYRRLKDGRKITYLLNRSTKHRKVVAMMKDYPDAALYDHETGTYTRLEGRRTGRKTQVQLRFQPNQSYFIVSNVTDAPAPKEFRESLPIEIRDLRVEVPFNVASIYHFRYTREGQEPVEMDVRSNPRFIPCNWSPAAPDFDQYAGTYEANVEIDANPNGIRLMLDKDFSECEVYVNESPTRLTPCCAEAQRSPETPPYLTDFQDVQASVGHLLKQGMNHFKVISPTRLSEPLRLVGQFHVRLKGKDVCAVEADQMNPFRLEMDYPFYSGTLTYKAAFNLNKTYYSLVLNLHDVRDAATIVVNGNVVGKRLWAPYTLDIAPFATPGPNTLEIQVRNNMTNLLGGNPRPLGLMNMPSLEAFEG